MRIILKRRDAGTTKLRDLTGQRFGRLTVICRANDFVCSSGRKITMWHCLCDCGTEKDIASTSLINRATTSCGCWNYEQMCNKEIKHKKHGERDTVLYQRWCGMKDRCNDPKRLRYNGRGITVCDEWKNDYMSFAEWSRNNGFREDLTLDRIDNDKGYYPENCRWTDITTQQNNKENNVRISFDGETHTQAEWSRLTGLNRYLIHDRLERGWSVYRTLTTPPKEYNRKR